MSKAKKKTAKMGRPPGSRNKHTKSERLVLKLLDSSLKTLDSVGGSEGMTSWVKKSDLNRGLFYRLITRLVGHLPNKTPDARENKQPLRLVLEHRDEPAEEAVEIGETSSAKPEKTYVPERLKTGKEVSGRLEHLEPVGTSKKRFKQASRASHKAQASVEQAAALADERRRKEQAAREHEMIESDRPGLWESVSGGEYGFH